MARCPECNKFATKDVETDPEITNDPEVDKDGVVTMSVRIHNDCADCSTELEEHEFELEGQVEVGEHKGKKHTLEIADTDPEVERTDSSGGRYAKRMFGVQATVQVNCSCGDSVGDVVLKDEVASSHMESVT